MKRFLIGTAIFGVLLFGSGGVVIAESHTDQYEEWREKNTHYIGVARRCLETKNTVKKLATEMEEMYGKDQNVLESFSNYIYAIHKMCIILERDNGAVALSKIKLSDMPGAMLSVDEPTKWFIAELLKAMKPLDDWAYVSDKTPIEAQKMAYAKLESIRFLHIIVKNLQNGGDLRRAISEVDGFEKLLQ